MTSLRQVSWLAGLYPSPPSRAVLCTAQWQPEEGFAADSCGGSSGFGPPSQRRIAPDSLLADHTRSAHLNARMEEACVFVVNVPNSHSRKV
jgi:hypothetical protein